MEYHRWLRLWYFSRYCFSQWVRCWGSRTSYWMQRGRNPHWSRHTCWSDTTAFAKVWRSLPSVAWTILLRTDSRWEVMDPETTCGRLQVKAKFSVLYKYLTYLRMCAKRLESPFLSQDFPGNPLVQLSLQPRLACPWSGSCSSIWNLARFGRSASLHLSWHGDGDQ